jgi:hypothetical protein
MLSAVMIMVELIMVELIMLELIMLELIMLELIMLELIMLELIMVELIMVSGTRRAEPFCPGPRCRVNVMHRSCPDQSSHSPSRHHHVPSPKP